MPAVSRCFVSVPTARFINQNRCVSAAKVRSRRKLYISLRIFAELDLCRELRRENAVGRGRTVSDRFAAPMA